MQLSAWLIRCDCVYMSERPTLVNNFHLMDSTYYRDVTTGRGLKYSVYYAKGTDPTKPTLLFLHGYPYSSYGWRHQVAFFQPLGYGIIVPDMLGYGGTDKPIDPELYAGTLIAKDILDILEIEPGTRVVVLGHDW